MSRVGCKIEETSVENESGRLVDGVCVTCGQCGDTAEAFGTGERSVKRALMTLRENCEEGGDGNFYVDEDG